MRLLFLGFSQIARRRALPAAQMSQCFQGIDVASVRSGAEARKLENLNGRVFDDYEQALYVSSAELVYVSLVNSDHAHWVEKSLRAGRHVIVDKPAFLDARTTERLASLAGEKKLLLAEATVFGHHPQIQLAKDYFQKCRSSPTRITAVFSVPPFAPGNFRLKKNLGGGAFCDLGPYAASTGRLFFAEEPVEVFCKVNRRDSQEQIDISFSVLATYSNGKSLVGHFGFDTEYRNSVNLLSANASITIDRVYTTPPDVENSILARHDNQEEILKAPKADPFLLFLKNAVQAVASGNLEILSKPLLLDARVLDRMRRSAGEE